MNDKDFEADYQRTISRAKIESDEKWREWGQKIPFIPFKDGWLVKPIPPFAGALARFLVKLPDGRVKSVYFDGYARLGAMDEPYWEVHPVNDDCGALPDERSGRAAEAHRIAVVSHARALEGNA